MKMNVHWGRVLTSLALLVLAVAIPGLVHSTPSGQTTSIEGGGFCSGDFTIYNNTVDNLIYGEQCSTGINVAAASHDAGSVFNTIDGTYGGTGEHIDFRSGRFNVVTSMVLTHSGAIISGAAVGQYVNFTSAYAPNFLSGTTLIATTSGITMMKDTSGTPTFTGTQAGGCTPTPTSVWVENLFFDANGIGGVGLNFAGCDEATFNVLFNDMFNGVYNCVNPPTCSTLRSQPGFSTAGVIFDGNSNGIIDYVNFDGTASSVYGGTNWGNALDIQWQSGAATGDYIRVENSKSAGAQMFKGNAGHIVFDNTEGNTLFEVLKSDTLIGTQVIVDNSEWGGGFGAGASGHFSIDTGTIGILKIVDTELDFATGWGLLSSGSAGTVTIVQFSASSIRFAGACTWNNGAGSITHSFTTADNILFSGSTCTGFPYTVTAGVF